MLDLPRGLERLPRPAEVPRERLGLAEARPPPQAARALPEDSFEFKARLADGKTVRLLPTLHEPMDGLRVADALTDHLGLGR